MTAGHRGYDKKKLSMVLILVTTLLISGIVVYTRMVGAEPTSADTAFLTNQNQTGISF